MRVCFLPGRFGANSERVKIIFQQFNLIIDLGWALKTGRKKNIPVFVHPNECAAIKDEMNDGNGRARLVFLQAPC
jgi:hypothetical protein